MAWRWAGSGGYLWQSTTPTGLTFNSWTVMAWMMRESAGASADEVALSLGDTGFRLYFKRTSVANWSMTNGSAFYDGSATPTAVWMHVALTCSGTGAGQLLAYRDAVLELTGAGNVAVTTGGLEFAAELSAHTSRSLMRLAAVKIYGRALTAAELAQEMWTYTPVSDAPLLKWLPIVSSAGASVGTDFTGGLSLTLSGGTVFDGPRIAWESTVRTWRPIVAPVLLPAYTQLNYRWRADDGGLQAPAA